MQEAARAMTLAIAPAPMNPTVSMPGAAQCLNATPPAAPVRQSVR
jgi:hypothetical protein